MMKLLSLILSLLLQVYQSADTSKTAANILLSNENANSFLQTKNRNRRGLSEGLREECCYENCDYEETAEFAKSYSWEKVYDALCEVSVVEKRSCRCKAVPGYYYECGGPSCRYEACICGGTKDSDDVEVIGVDYDIAKGSLSQNPVAAATKVVNNLNGKTEVKRTFVVSKEVTEEEYFEHTAGATLEIGTTFEAGVPVVARAKISTTLSRSYEHTWGKTTSKTSTISFEFPCTAPAHRYVVCNAMLNTGKMSVPYTMTIKHKHYGCTCRSKGTYVNVHHAGISVETNTYTSIPSGDEAKDVKSVEDQSPLSGR